MSRNSKGLGKGLDALLKGYNEEPKSSDSNSIPIDSIAPNPFQPRKHFSDESLRELAESIRNQGVLQPILVRQVPDSSGADSYELIAGERRFRASKLAGLDEIPALIRDFSDEESLAIALIENLQREDLNPIEEAVGIHQLQTKFELSQDDLAKRIGKSRPAVANTLRLLQLPEYIQDDVRNNELSAGHARSLLALHDEDAQRTVWGQIKNQNLSVRDVEYVVQYVREHGELPETMQAKAPSRSRKSKEAANDPNLEHIEQQIFDALEIRAQVQGSMAKGKLVLNYATEDQLQGLLALLGIQ